MTGIAIETINLTRRYGALTAVQGLNLRVPRASVYGFLGPNGAGKTTTIRMLLGLIRPTEGQVRLFGAPLEGERGALLGRVGALVETPSLYPHLTGGENLEVTRRLLGVGRERIPEVLGIVGLREQAGRLVRQYSHGMRQRLALALALLNRPELLILDEPTNGLDPAGIREMRDLIRSLAEVQGITVFLSSHLLNEVEQVATHIGVIDRGVLRFQGRLDELQHLRGERVALVVDRPGAASEALREAGYQVLAVEGGRLVVAADGERAAAEINAALVSRGIAVRQLNLAGSSLEETFMRLTEAED